VRAVHERSGKALAEELEVERGFFGSLAGLMFRRSLEPGHGMWIVDCNGIHMLFMNFAIDAVFLDRQERVKKIYRNLPAHSVLELPAGSTAEIDLQRGDRILL